MQKRTLRYSEWVSESEIPEAYKVTQEDLDEVTKNCKITEVLEKTGHTPGLRYVNSHRFVLEISTTSLKKYFDLLEKSDIEFIPHYFDKSPMKINFVYDKKIGDGKYYVDHIKSERESRKQGPRLFEVSFSANDKDQLSKLVNDALEEIASDIKKVRVMIQVGKKDLPESLRPKLKKKVLDEYREIVDSFFYKGESTELEKSGIGEILADLYASDKTLLDTISDIENKETLDSIIKSLEKMEETDLVKVIKAYLRSSRILKDL